MKLRTTHVIAAVILATPLLASAQKLDAEVFTAAPQKADASKKVRVTTNKNDLNISDADVYIGPNSKGKAFDFNFDAADGKATVYERTLGRWKDPFTLPRTRAECVKWASGDIPFDGSWKTCIGHKYQSQWMYSTLVLRVDVATPQAIREHAEQCLQDAGLVSALAGISTALIGNPGAVQTAVSTFTIAMKVCLASKVKDLANVSVRTDSGWGDYE